MKVFTSNADAHTPHTADVPGCVDAVTRAHRRTEDDRGRRDRGRLRTAPRSDPLAAVALLWRRTLPQGIEGAAGRRSPRREHGALHEAESGRTGREGSTHEADCASGNHHVPGSGNLAEDGGCNRSLLEDRPEDSRHDGTGQENEIDCGHGRFARPVAASCQYRLEPNSSYLLQLLHNGPPVP
jgi:hypothetical protein